MIVLPRNIFTLLGTIGILFAPMVGLNALESGTNIVYEVAVQIDFHPGEDFPFHYRYTVSNGISSAQRIWLFAVLVPTNSISDIQGSTQPAWTAGVSEQRGWIDWGATSRADFLAPGKRVDGLTFASTAPPGVVDAFAQGRVRPPKVLFVSTDTPHRPDVVENSVHTRTIGATLGTTPAQPSELLARLVTLKHQALDQGWIYGSGAEGVANSLDAKLDGVQKSMQSNDTRTASNQLSAFIDELDAQRGKHVNDSAYFLLKVNAELVLSKLK